MRAKDYATATEVTAVLSTMLGFAETMWPPPGVCLRMAVMVAFIALGCLIIVFIFKERSLVIAEEAERKTSELNNREIIVGEIEALKTVVESQNSDREKLNQLRGIIYATRRAIDEAATVRGRTQREEP